MKVAMALDFLALSDFMGVDPSVGRVGESLLLAKDLVVAGCALGMICLWPKL